MTAQDVWVVADVRHEHPSFSVRLSRFGGQGSRFPRVPLLVACVLSLVTYIPAMGRPMDLTSVDYVRHSFASVMTLAIITSCSAVVVMCFEAVVRRSGKRLTSGWLIASVILGGGVASVTVIVLEWLGLFPFRDAQPVVVGIRMSLGLTVMLWLIRLSKSTLSREAERARAALRIVHEDQRRILDREENARRELASFLHDRVQADLLVVGLQLQRIAESDVPPQPEELRSIIERVETIRQEGVRDVARRLSPPLRETGLDAVLTELAMTWATAMNVTVHLDVEVEHSIVNVGTIDLELAVYRIVEQALLNAAAHGRASEVSVEVTSRRPDEVAVRVADNGVGLESQPISHGSGLAIISVWTGLMGGTWSLNSVGGHTELLARLPLVRPVTMGGHGEHLERRDSHGDRRRTQFGTFPSGNDMSRTGQN